MYDLSGIPSDINRIVRDNFRENRDYTDDCYTDANDARGVNHLTGGVVL